MTKLTELGFTDEEVKKILAIAQIFKAQKMTVKDIKIVDKSRERCIL